MLKQIVESIDDNVIEEEVAVRFMRQVEDFILEGDEDRLQHIEKFIKTRREQLK